MHGHLPVVVRSTVPPAPAPAASLASLPAQVGSGEVEVAKEVQALIPPWLTGPQALAAAA